MGFGFSQEILEGNARPTLGFSHGLVLCIGCVYGLVVRSVGVTLLLMAGCAPAASLEFPSDPRVQSYLLVGSNELSGQLFAFAFAAEPQSVLAAIPDETPLVLLGYDRSLAELAILPKSGPIGSAFEVAISPDLERPIPVQDGLLWQRSGARLEKITQLPIHVASARLTAFAGACSAQGGCPELRDGVEYCILGCAPPEPLPPAPPLPPQPPELPVLTPCPLDWAAVSATISSLPGQPTVTRCAAPALGLALRCGPGEAAFAGAVGCAPVGVPCPASGFDPAVVADLYVDGAAGPGGDGTRLAPLDTLERAITVAAQRGLDRIAVAAGDYVFAGLRDRGLSIIGACAAQTRLQLAPRVVIRAGPLRFSQLTLLGSIDPVGASASPLEVVPPGSLALDSVVLEGGVGPAIGVSSSTITLDRVALRGIDGGGLRLDRSRSTLHEVVVQDTLGHAIQLRGGRAQISQLAVSGLRVRPPANQDAIALLAEDVSFTVDQAELSDIEGVAVFVTTASAALDRIRIDDVRQAPPLSALPNSGGGICVFGSTVSVSRSSIARVSGSGLLAYFGGRLRASDVVLSDPRPSNALGSFVCASGARCSLVRAAILRSPTALVAQGSPGTEARDVFADGQGLTSTKAPALNVYETAPLSVARVASVGSAHAGMIVALSTAQISDLWVDDGLGGPIAPFGLSLSETTGSVDRARIAGSDRLLSIAWGTMAVRDVDLGFNRAQPQPQANGMFEASGIWLLRAALRLERARIHDIQDLAALFFNSPSLVLVDLDVETVRRAKATIDAAVLLVWFADHDWAAGSPAEVRRLRISGAENTALAVEDLGLGARPIHLLEDVLVQRSTGDCEPNPDTTPRTCGTFDLRGTSRTSGARWGVEGVGLRLLRLNVFAELRATDVRLRGGPSSMLLALENSPEVEVERFALSGPGICVHFQGPDRDDTPRLQLAKGRLDCETSFETGCQFDGQQALREVLLKSDRGLRCEHPLQQLGR